MKIRLKHKIFLIAVLLILVVGFIRDSIVKFSVTRAVKLTTGLDVKIDSLKIGFLLKRFAEIKNLEIRNPRAFPDRVMADIPEIYIDYDLPSVFTNNMFLHEMRLSLKEFSIIKNEKGELNLDGIKLPKSESPKDVQIGNLRLKIAKIIYRDYSKTPAEVKEFNLNLDERFSNIESLNALARVVLARAVTSTAVRNYINYDADALKASVEGILAEGEKVIGGAVGDALRGATEKIKSIFK